MQKSVVFRCLLLCLSLLLFLPVLHGQQEFEGYVELDEAPFVFSEENVKVTPPKILVEKKEANFTIELWGLDKRKTSLEVVVDGLPQSVVFTDGVGEFYYKPGKGSKKVVVAIEGFSQEVAIRPIPLWMSILPPLLAIFLALVFREVVVSLFLGLFLGTATIGYFYSDSFWGIGHGFLDVVKDYLISAIAQPDHISIIVFTLFIGGIVALISRNGGMQGVVNGISKIAKKPASGQFATWLLGIAIFFDDYANSLVVGNTMRSITDKLLISREKLAYIVDSTAAPVAALAFITTWIGAELGYISDATERIAGFPVDQSAYSIFLSSLQYSFYPILALLFILILIFTGRDFGPMLHAERRARTTGQVSRDIAEGDGDKVGSEDLSPVEGATPRAFNAVLPVVLLIFGVIAGLLYTGWDAAVWEDNSLHLMRKLSQMVGNADTYAALLWASLSALIFAIVLTMVQGFMGLARSIETAVSGFKAMLPALIILALAWSLADLTEVMGTDIFLIDTLGQALPPVWLPAITFFLAAAIAFSTGSSWGTMAILYPLMLGLAWETGLSSTLTEHETLHIFFNVVSAVLAGSVLGDHCSPISDTTVLSSLASDCNHIDHVRTQLPYALTVGVVGTLLGTVPSSFGVPTWICYLASLFALVLIVMIFGKKAVPKVKAAPETSPAT